MTLFAISILKHSTFAGTEQKLYIINSLITLMKYESGTFGYLFAYTYIFESTFLVHYADNLSWRVLCRITAIEAYNKMPSQKFEFTGFCKFDCYQFSIIDFLTICKKNNINVHIFSSC